MIPTHHLDDRPSAWHSAQRQAAKATHLAFTWLRSTFEQIEPPISNRCSNRTDAQVWCTDAPWGNVGWSANEPTTNLSIERVSAMEMRGCSKTRHHAAIGENDSLRSSIKGKQSDRHR
ncbi:hypothetical protein IQ268_27100 [Oculatella sp. LEGE 06141]|uniref:hypothetical protein n=1 Tax=Oculatella sp. LEGE 06141 TaxID=1828648 RepID=UPI001880F294|nr:hypothetical protein [Oculatella sp. LEGE 06141]MBE9182239.1 hypothetical protein [Oculatella sp. LEGE 06141]